MREIKFRVWSQKEKKWMFGYEFPELGGFSLTGETILLGEFSKYPLTRYFEDFIIEQFTGLKDKNGVDIYEGDIVESVHLDISDDIPEEDVKYIYKNHIVIFKNGCFQAEDSYFGFEGEGLIELNLCTIVGNIHIKNIQ